MASSLRNCSRAGLRLALLLSVLIPTGTTAWAASPLVFDTPPVDLDHEASRGSGSDSDYDVEESRGGRRKLVFDPPPVDLNHETSDYSGVYDPTPVFNPPARELDHESSRDAGFEGDDGRSRSTPARRDSGGDRRRTTREAEKPRQAAPAQVTAPAQSVGSDPSPTPAQRDSAVTAAQPDRQPDSENTAQTAPEPVAKPETVAAPDPQPAVVAEPGGAERAGAAPASERASTNPTQAAAKPSEVKTIRLFGMVEFRSPLKNVPKWERVYNLEKSTPTFGDKVRDRMSKDVADRWLALKAKLDGKPLEEQLRGVNNFFNQWPYKSDMQVWKVEDYWATPAEFLRKSGDCEDYAIVKYYALRDLGVPANQLRIVALRDSIRGIGHAVLVVFMKDNAYVLDNLSNLILPHTKLTHYQPVFSVNEEFRWAHVKPLKQK